MLNPGTPADATRSAQHARHLGLRYVTGAVMVPTPMVGTDDSMALYAGAADDIDAARPLFTAMGGSSELTLGERPYPPTVNDPGMVALVVELASAESDPVLSRVLFLKAAEHYATQLGDMEGAVACYNRILESDSSDEEVLAVAEERDYARRFEADPRPPAG